MNIVDVLNKLTANEAQARLIENCNTIWEITNLLINCRLNVLQRLEGKVMVTPANKYFGNVANISDEAWVDTLKNGHEDTKARGGTKGKERSKVLPRC